MPFTHRVLAAVVAALWGVNFVAIGASLEQFPPFFLVALRFAIIAIPVVLLGPMPNVPLKWFVVYGACFGILQFVFLYSAMATGMPAGLSSLVLQSSAPFTVILGALFFADRVSSRQVVGLVIAAVGLSIVGWNFVTQAPLLPFVLVLAGGLAWAVGNIANARAHAPNPLHFTLWMAVIPPAPMLVLSMFFEGPERILTSLATATENPGAIAGLGYTVVLGTVVGSGIWSWLMARHSASVVAPFSMLVPVAGFASAAIAFGEQLPAAKLIGGTVCVAGVLLATRRRANSPPVVSSKGLVKIGS